MPSGSTPARVHYGHRAHGLRGGNIAVSPGAAKSGTGSGGGTSAFEIFLAVATVANMSDGLKGGSKAFGQVFVASKGAVIDNPICQLFYLGTTIILVLTSLLATSKQAFGDPISCEVVRLSNYNVNN